MTPSTSKPTPEVLMEAASQPLAFIVFLALTTLVGALAALAGEDSRDGFGGSGSAAGPRPNSAL